MHSDRGGHYLWPGWLESIDNARLPRSMSRRGYSPDNAACEAFLVALRLNFLSQGLGQSNTRAFNGGNRQLYKMV